MKRRKIIALITIMLVSLTTLLTACDNRSIYEKVTSSGIEDGTNEVSEVMEELAPEQCVGAYYDYIIKGDSTALKNIGIESNDVKNISDRREDAKIELQEQFNGTGISFTNEQVDRMVNAEIKVLMKLKNSFEVEEKDDETAIIKVSSTYIDIAKISQLAAASTIAELKGKNIQSEEELYSILPENFISNLEKRLDAAVPSKEMKDIQVEFKKTIVNMDNENFNVWKCENETDFSATLLNLVITNQTEKK